MLTQTHEPHNDQSHFSFYRPPMKLREANVFSSVCLSVHRRVSYDHYPWCLIPNRTGIPPGHAPRALVPI